MEHLDTNISTENKSDSEKQPCIPDNPDSSQLDDTCLDPSKIIETISTEDGTNTKEDPSLDSPDRSTDMKKMDNVTSDSETVEHLRTQLGILMDSLATLSAEKSKMEATFQNDRKQLRNERDECEKVIKDLKERLKKAQSQTVSELEHVKCKLIMERHERDKEQANHTAMMRELQKLLTEERRMKEQLETQVKSQFASKTQCKILEAELEITKTKLKEAEQAVKETPPLLVALQAEMTVMKDQHRNAIQEEQRRAISAEQRARTLATMHETRVAGLEARLAELSETVGGYDRLRQQDQQAILKLKDQLTNIQDENHKELADTFREPEELVNKIKASYEKLLTLDNQKKDSIYLQSLLNNLGLCSIDKMSEYKDKYECILQEFKDYKHQMSRNNVSINLSKMKHSPIDFVDNSNNKTQLNILKTHNSQLEEKIHKLTSETMTKEKELECKLEQQQKLLYAEREQSEHVITKKENEYRRKLVTLEQQLINQRIRSIALVEEKDKEISTLKTSFHAILPQKRNGSSSSDRKMSSSDSSSSNLPERMIDLVPSYLSAESPPILHYNQELARRDVQISTFRKRSLELEAKLRENQRDMLHTDEKYKDQSKTLQAQITRLEACKYRDGASLEYLKNVFVNFLTTCEPSSKRHMLNAISAVLRFTPDELEKIKCCK